MYDQRLFNQSGGLGHGFGDEEDYNLYDKPLFTDRTAASIYKNVKNIDEDQAAETNLPQGSQQEIKNALQINQKPNRGFEGTQD